jgi:carbonic anhydrase
LQYAGRHLKTPLFVVLGHTRCGAVQAALDTQRTGARHHSHIQILVDCIMPGLAGLDQSADAETLAAQAVEFNVRWSVRQILETPGVKERAGKGVMKLIGAIYDIETGSVRFLDESAFQG